MSFLSSRSQNRQLYMHYGAEGEDETDGINNISKKQLRCKCYEYAVHLKLDDRSRGLPYYWMIIHPQLGLWEVACPYPLHAPWTESSSTRIPTESHRIQSAWWAVWQWLNRIPVQAGAADFFLEIFLPSQWLDVNQARGSYGYRGWPTASHRCWKLAAAEALRS